MRITPKNKTATCELYEVQRKIAKHRAALKELELAEEQLIIQLEPIYSSEPINRTTEVIINGTPYTVKYVHVERDIINLPAIERAFAKLGKAVPKKHNEYSLLKVSKS